MDALSASARDNYLRDSMMKESIEKAKILIESLPYMQEFRNKTVVIKYGGHAMVDENLKRQFALDLSLIHISEPTRRS
jgi:acetylglutamate kinase